jgi:hypothetical protein
MKRFLAAAATAICLSIMAAPVASAQPVARPQASAFCIALFNLGICL